jgi:dihydrofolate reductase
MRISLIAAASDNDVIGKDNDLPWHLPDDFRHFKRTTRGHHVLMGRRTWESQHGKPLPHRVNIVVSSQPDYQAPGATLVRSLAEGYEIARAAGEDELFVIGGTRIYAEALEVADRIYLTRVHTQLEGDAHFPPYDPAQWRELDRERHEADPRHAHAFTILTLERI